MYEKTCYAIQLFKEGLETLDEFNNRLNALEQVVSTKEDSINITTARKLSENGDFTGTIYGVDGMIILSNIESNNDKIQFLTNQFEDGATGLVIDCGYFGDDEINKSYDGGVW